MILSRKILNARMYRSKETTKAKQSLAVAVKNGSGINEAREAYSLAITKECNDHRNKTVPIFHTGTITGESPVVSSSYDKADYFAVPGKWTNGSNPYGFALYAYFDSISAGTMDPATYAIGIITNYTTEVAARDLYSGRLFSDVQLTSSAFGSAQDGFSDGLLFSQNGAENAFYDQQEIQLIVAALGIDQTKFGVFFQNNVTSGELFDLKFNGTITQLIGSQEIYLTNKTTPYANVNTFTFVTGFYDDTFFWLWILFLAIFLLLMVAYFDLWFPTPRPLVKGVIKTEVIQEGVKFNDIALVKK